MPKKKNQRKPASATPAATVRKGRMMNPLPTLAAGEKRVLHVGCGQATREKLPKIFRDDHWKEVRLDINEKVNPDIISDMTDMHMLEDGSMDGLFSSHNIEHLFPHQVPGALKEFNRVLKVGGVMVITMPDLQTVAAYIAEGMLEEPLYQSSAGSICPIDIIYGWRREIAHGNHFMAHKGGFTAKSLTRHLFASGFSNIRLHREWVNLWAVAHKFPKDHPNYSTKLEVMPSLLRGPEGQRTPFWYERRIQLSEDPEAPTDMLDQAPAFYKAVFTKTE